MKVILGLDDSTIGTEYREKLKIKTVSTEYSWTYQLGNWVAVPDTIACVLNELLNFIS